MEFNSEGHPSPFARLSTNGSSPTLFQNMSEGALVLPRPMQAWFQGVNQTAHAEAQQPSSGDLPVLKSKRISDVMHTAVADIGYAPDATPSAPVPQFEEMTDTGNGYAAINPSFGHNASVQSAQAQAALAMSNMYNDRLPHPETTTPMPPVPPLPNVAGIAYHPQHPQFHYSTNPSNYTAVATMGQNPYPNNPTGAIQSSPMTARYANQLPPWREPHTPEAQPVAFSGIHMGSISVPNSLGRDIPSARNYALPPNGHQTGNPPSQPHVVNILSPEVPQSRADMGHAWNAGDHVQAAGNGGNSQEYQKESIDVDNEANNICWGVNWEMRDEPIDLSNDAEVTPKLKKDRKKEEKVSKQQQRGYRIPLKSDDVTSKLANSKTTSSQIGSKDGARNTGFQDPLWQTQRRDTGPPIRPFSSPAPTNSPVRRSPRHTKSNSRKTDIELTDSSKQAQPSDANVDVPLGGLGKSARELKTETGGLSGRRRSNNKRRRPNSGTEVEGPGMELDSNYRKEKQRNTTTLDKRRTKRDTRKKKSRKEAPRKPQTKASTKGVAADEDSDDYFEIIRNTKLPAIGSRGGVPTQSQGDSPQSNTVGDVSQSDDENVGAGNELSSDDDDDDGSSFKKSPRRRHIQRQEVSGAITISDSPVQTRKPRKPRSPATPQTARTPRKSRTTEASCGVASKSMRHKAVHDFDGEHFSTSPKDCANKANKKFEERKPRGSKRMKQAKTPLSPVNLVSPTPSGLERKGVRKSPRNAKGRPSSKQRADDFVADSSDEDFEASRVSARTREKTKRRTPANETSTRSRPKERYSSLRGGAESEDKLDRVDKSDGLIDLTDEEPKSLSISPSDEDSDVEAEFPSQEQGSQPIDLKVKVVPKRKKAGPKVFLEREFLKLSTDELSIIRVAFIKRYPSPPSNMQAQGRYEAAHGTAMSSGMVQRTWETQLKPWSKRWWDFYLDFNTKVREKKAAKPRNKDPTLKESEVKSWVEEYYRQHGDAKPNITDAATEASHP